MEKIPDEFQLQFFRLFTEEISVPEFETWLYAAKELELILGEPEYYELISLNFKDKDVIGKIKNVSDHYLNYGEFEKRKVKNMLNNLISRNEHFPKSLMAAYDLCCHGYNFLETLGMNYGLAFRVDFSDYSVWEKLSSKKQDE